MHDLKMARCRIMDYIVDIWRSRVSSHLGSACREAPRKQEAAARLSSSLQHGRVPARVCGHGQQLAAAGSRQGCDGLELLPRRPARLPHLPLPGTADTMQQPPQHRFVYRHTCTCGTRQQAGAVASQAIHESAAKVFHLRTAAWGQRPRLPRSTPRLSFVMSPTAKRERFCAGLPGVQLSCRCTSAKSERPAAQAVDGQCTCLRQTCQHSA